MQLARGFATAFAAVVAFTASAQELFKPDGLCTYSAARSGEDIVTFAADSSMKTTIEELIVTSGRRATFTVKAANVAVAAAAIQHGIRFILYNQDVFSELREARVKNPQAMCALAHALAHHLLKHNLNADVRQRREQELQADSFAGRMLFRMQITRDAARNAARAALGADVDTTYPTAPERVAAIIDGWNAEDSADQDARHSGFAYSASDDEGIPSFEWPPPTPSGRADVPRNLLIASGSVQRLDDVGSRLTIALGRAGYRELSYFAVPHGFALVTRLEQIDSDGTPKNGPNRWSVQFAAPLVFSLREYLRALLTATPGYYRIVAFVVTDLPITSKATTTNFAVAKDWLWMGSNRLPASIGILKYSESYSCTVLIYEFEQRSGEESVTMLTPSPVPADEHLRRARIWESLGSR
jgi:hypothetical protein